MVKDQLKTITQASAKKNYTLLPTPPFKNGKKNPARSRVSVGCATTVKG